MTYTDKPIDSIDKAAPAAVTKRTRRLWQRPWPLLEVYSILALCFLFLPVLMLIILSLDML